jgi:vacuole morphology and inheritance protein 14
LLADILHEIRDVTTVSRQLQQRPKSKSSMESLRRNEFEPEILPELNMESAERSLLLLENDEQEILVHESQIRNAGQPEFDRDIGGEQSSYAVLNANSQHLY